LRAEILDYEIRLSRLKLREFTPHVVHLITPYQKRPGEYRLQPFRAAAMMLHQILGPAGEFPSDDAVENIRAAVQQPLALQFPSFLLEPVKAPDRREVLPRLSWRRAGKPDLDLELDAIAQPIDPAASRS